jgi:hypothetical protein
MLEVLAFRDIELRSQQQRLERLQRQLGEQIPEDRQGDLVAVLDRRVAISQASKLLRRALRPRSAVKDKRITGVIS